MTEQKFPVIEIGEGPYNGATYALSAPSKAGERHGVHIQDDDYDVGTFNNIRKAVAVELPEAVRKPKVDGKGHYWACTIGGRIRIPAESRLDDLIETGMAALAVKLKIAETPTLANDLDTVLTHSRLASNAGPLRDAAERLTKALETGAINIDDAKAQAKGDGGEYSRPKRPTPTTRPAFMFGRAL
ncbi:hypothetical protein AB0E01_22675 [Nocardia vinacea]|uniref:hypothetical protein n=1 Tax=Nocardia vinacea TaxID=96468 RepID=UPI003409ACF3